MKNYTPSQGPRSSDEMEWTHAARMLDQASLIVTDLKSALQAMVVNFPPMSLVDEEIHKQAREAIKRAEGGG